MRLPEHQPHEEPHPEFVQRTNQFRQYAIRVLSQFGIFQSTPYYSGDIWGNYYMDDRESLFFARRFAAHLLQYVVTNHAGRMNGVDPQLLDYLNLTQPPQLIGYRSESREQILDTTANAVCQALIDEGEAQRLILETSDILAGRKISLVFPHPQLSSIWNVNKAFRDHAVPPRT